MRDPVPDSLIKNYRRIAAGTYLEGLSCDFARDVIWYSDVIAGGIHGVRPDGAAYASFNPDRMWTGGVMMNACGAVLSSGQGGIMWNNPDTGASGWLLDTLDGRTINGVNEMWPDGTGGIYFGTNDIDHIIVAEKTRPTALYRLTAEREVIKLSDNVYFSNGIAFDAARRKFYCSDTFNKAWVWDVADDFSLINQQVLLDKDDCDGLALDHNGDVWITGFRSPGILTRISAAGHVLPPVATPPGATTQIRFGGADLCDVYLNIVPTGGGDSLKEGQALTAPSYLYRGRSAVPGLAVDCAHFVLA